MLRVEVAETLRTGTKVDKDTGEARPWAMQRGWVFLAGEKHPTKVDFFAPKGKPYPAGNYQLAPDAFYVNRSGNLTVDVGRLVALQPAQRAAG